MPNPEKDAVLLLEDGTSFVGKGFGADGTVEGEVVFNTGMVGYPESLTDPSYFGQILVATWPLVGNYGVAGRGIVDQFGVPLHFESSRIQVTGYAISELEAFPSHWTSRASLSDWLAEDGIPGISGIDSRELTKKLRVQGTMLGLLSVGTDVDSQALRKRAKSIRDPNSLDLVSRVTVPEPRDYSPQGGPMVVIVDCGMKLGILRNLLARGLSVRVVPYDTSADDIIGAKPAGVVISNGPGDPKLCTPTVKSVRALLETDVPIFGICLGTQVLALGAGGETFKLKFGHRAQNHPCGDLKTGRVYITTQNHGYTVDPKSLDAFEVSFVNLNDKTIEGIRHKKKNVMGVQFHPEASPGPYETGFLFDEFAKVARGFQSARA
ncbi:MAG: glutamine-hydrolyzing carbamoyl-phosphate synthase small subunit [Nitrososphaerales archaeon]|nr:glutamine-hydrolyzing carbamoyl-phosphate synthase small subunit [Nitrososphaerales archaeon]